MLGKINYMKILQNLQNYMDSEDSDVYPVSMPSDGKECDLFNF